MAQPLTDSINALTRYANTVTGASDTTLSEAVATLANGYGQCGVDYLEQYLTNTLTTYTNDSVTKIPAYAFKDATNLVSVHLPNVTDSGGYAFDNTGITVLALPKYYVLNAWQTFANMKKCTKIDTRGRAFSQQCFWNCTVLDTLILRNTSVVNVLNMNNFNNTPFASGGTGGTLYVPQDLISSYQSATNWSTIIGYANNQILPIEGSIYETQYADGTPIE